MKKENFDLKSGVYVVYPFSDCFPELARYDSESKGWYFCGCTDPTSEDVFDFIWVGNENLLELLTELTEQKIQEFPLEQQEMWRNKAFKFENYKKEKWI